MAQRLVRKVCPDCREECQPTQRELRELGLLSADAGLSDIEQKNGKFFVGKGCDKCFQTGFRGRTGVYELMMISEEIQELIYRRESAGAIKRAALNSGLQTLRMDGTGKVIKGITTIKEVLRVTQADIM